MEQQRYQLVLGKYPVIEIKFNGFSYKVTLEMTTGIYTHFITPFKPDLNPGDLLTLYTEVCNAHP